MATSLAKINIRVSFRGGLKSIQNELTSTGKCYRQMPFTHGNFLEGPRRGFNSNIASICKIGRKVYTRQYPTLLVQPDGSTLTVRYPLPVKLITLPIDVSQMSEEEKKVHLLKRKPKQKIVIEEEIEDDFDINQYTHLWKKK